MDDKKATNPKDDVATSRLDLSLFPATARAYGALAMTEGDLKYGGFNYRTAGVRVSIYYAAANRHLDKWFNGEWADSKTQVPHLASALACISVIIDGIECGNVTDDRPPTCDVASLLDDMEDKVKHLQKLFPDGPGRHTATQNNESAPPDNVINRDEIIGEEPASFDPSMVRATRKSPPRTGKPFCP